MRTLYFTMALSCWK